MKKLLPPKIWIICRVCTKQHQDLVNIFDDVVDKSIWLLLRDCGGVPVRKNDDLPDKICEECLRKLWRAKDFRLDCQRSHRDLVQMLIERNALKYNMDLEEEYACRSEIIITSSTTNDFRSMSSLINLEEQTFITKAPENIATPRNKKIDIENDDSIHDIKQYCVVPKKEEDLETTNQDNLDKKEPIVLLLKLQKNIPSEKSNTVAVANKIEAVKETTCKLKPFKQLSKGSKKTATSTNENSKLNSKTTKSILKRKLKSNLNGTKSKFVCNVCKKTFKTDELLRHHKYTHKRPHECKICHKTFSQRMAFLSHNNHHSGCKPYYCRICHKTFADIGNRNSHERNMHVQEVHKCELCPKKFRFLDLLRKHAQSHRPKICFICNKKFATLHIVRSHHQRRHLKQEN